MPITLAETFQMAEALAAEAAGQAVLLRVSHLSFQLLQSGVPARWQGMPLCTPGRITAEFEYFGLGPPEERWFTARRAVEAAAGQDPEGFQFLFQGRFRLHRHGPRPSRQPRLPRATRYSFETSHAGFQPLAVALVPSATRQAGCATRPPTAQCEPAMMVAEFVLEELQVEG